MKNNKKICIVTRALINGGAERVIAQLANYFVKNGIECSIITIDVAAVAYELDTRINVDAIGKKADNKVKDRFFRYAALRKKIMRYKPDVVLSMPEDIGILGVNGVNQIWRNAKLRGTGMKRAKILVSAAEHSVGSKEAPEAARIELKNLLNDMDVYVSRMEELLQTIEEKLKTIPYVDKLMEIKGIGLITVSGFIAEVGDIGRFDNPKQLQKLAGYAIVANDSGKHNGESRISYRGRKRLRYVLYEAAISLVGKNAEFKEIHEYYRTRKENPLKKMQSVVAVACKIIRVFYTILTKGVDYDPMKLMSDIRRPQLQAA